MSAIPLNGSDSFGSDFGGFDGAPAMAGLDNFPPPPGTPPPVPTVATMANGAGPTSAAAPSLPPSLVAPPPMQRPLPPPAPTAVDGRYSVAGPPLGTYGALGDPSALEAAPVFPPAVPQENGHTLGLALILVGVGTVVGIKWLGGLYGGAAGGLYGGAAVNLIRAARAVTVGTPDADREAIISGTYGVVGAGVASYILYQGRKERRAS